MASNATLVVIERDYSKGLTAQFSTVMPQELRDRISQDEFVRIVEYVNECIMDSDSVTCGSACENITAYLTCFLSLLFCKTHSQRVCSVIKKSLIILTTNILLFHELNSVMKGWTSSLQNRIATMMILVLNLFLHWQTDYYILI